VTTHPTTTTTTTPTGSWFYTLLTKSGVDPSTAHTVDTLVIRPLEIIIVILGALLVAHYGARLLRRLLTHLSRRATAARSDSERAGARLVTLIGLILNMWRAFVGIVALLIILGIFGINLTPILASATIIGATVGFGAQSLVRDYLSGVLLTLEDQYAVGDTISVNDTTGTVEELTLRVTRLRGVDGSLWYVPNGEIRKLSNRSRGWAKAVVDLTIAPTQADSIEEAKRIALEAAMEAARDPRFGGEGEEAPQVVGVISSETGVCTLRVTARTRPVWRDPLERAIRERTIEQLIGAGLWSSTDDA
jgi:small conductance mechanosensitive channel